MTLVFNQAAHSIGQIIWICFLKILIGQNFKGFQNIVSESIKFKFLPISLYGNGHTIYGGCK